MGVILRQGLKGTIVSYIGVLLGIMNIMFLLPAILNPEEVGLIRIIIDSSFLLSTYAKLGITNTAIKFFPYFKKEKKYFGFLGIILVALSVGILIVTTVSFLFQDLISAQFISKSPLFVNYFVHVLALMALYTLMQGFATYSSLLQRITIPKLVIEVLLRLGITIPILLFYYKLIAFDSIFLLLGSIYSLSFLILIFYIQFQKKIFLKFKFSNIDKELIKSMKEYMGYMILGGSGAIIVAKIDSIMIGSLRGLTDSGIYGIAFFMAVLVELPKRSLTSISSPIISQHFKDGAIDKVKSIYKKSALNLLIIGGLFFLLIWLNIDNIFQLVPNSEVYSQGKYVVLFIALAKLIDMSTGVCNTIIANSNFYKWNIFIMPVFAIIVIITNLLLIPNLGINGAAIASMISIFLYSVTRVLLVKIKLGITPFSINTLKVIAIILISYTAGIQSIYESSNVIINLIIKSTQILIVFTTLLIVLKPSEDIQEIIVKFKTNFLK